MTSPDRAPGFAFLVRNSTAQDVQFSNAFGLLEQAIAAQAFPGCAIAITLGAEFVIHYHSDWAKAQLDCTFQLDNRSTRYWIIFGADQLIHQLTYLGMTAALFFRIVPGMTG